MENNLINFIQCIDRISNTTGLCNVQFTLQERTCNVDSENKNDTLFQRKI